MSSPKAEKKASPIKKKTNRVKTGCLVCRSKRRKCDEMKNIDEVTGKVKCGFCFKKKLDCSWPALQFGPVFINSSLDDREVIEKKKSDTLKKVFLISEPVTGATYITRTNDISRPEHSRSNSNGNTSDHHEQNGMENGNILSDSKNINSHPTEDKSPVSFAGQQRLQPFSLGILMNETNNGSERQNKPVQASYSHSQNNSLTQNSRSFSKFRNILPKSNSGSVSNLNDLAHTPNMSNIHNQNNGMRNTPNSMISSPTFDPNGSSNTNFTNLKPSTSTLSFKNYNFNLLHTSTTPMDSSSQKPTPQLMNNTYANSIELGEINKGLSLNFKEKDLLRETTLHKDALDYNNFVDILEDTQPQYYDIPDTLRDFMYLNAANQLQSPLSIPSDVPPLDVFNEYFRSDNFANIEPPSLTDTDRILLMSNYVNEVAQWLDMFDKNRHFGQILPAIAEDCPSLYYSILALSAKMYENTHQNYPKDMALTLYQYALQKLVGCYDGIDTGLRASCVILCVFAMLSSSPKTWRRNLEGCAVLFKSHGIHGFREPVERAIFWCFVRMDVCAAVIGEQVTIVDSKSWLPPGSSIYDSESLFLKEVSETNWDMYANYMVYLCSRVMNLISGSDLRDKEFEKEWKLLWEELRRWESNKPVTMKPIFESDEAASTFPVILFSNPAGISGNEMYHMATILMLENKPRLLKWSSLQSESSTKRDDGSTNTTDNNSSTSSSSLSSAVVASNRNSSLLNQQHMHSKSLTWHTRRICGIGIANADHGARTNSLQPLWVAGRLTSSVAEHNLVLKHLNDIEKETGWPTRYRAKDLIEYWSGVI